MAKRTTLTPAETTFVNIQRVARLATADAEGNPHVIPVCYAFDGERFYTPLDEKPKRVAASRLRRVRNIETRPEVALVIDQYDDDWSRLGYVLVQGRAEMLPPGDRAHAQVLVLLRERYLQYKTMALEKYAVIAITPERIVSWGPAIGK
jgi:PPOX class probable F420-dependent enzyme